METGNNFINGGYNMRLENETGVGRFRRVGHRKETKLEENVAGKWLRNTGLEDEIKLPTPKPGSH